MNAQKDNREDTVISQDAPYFLDAIRNGAPVTNYNGVNVLAASAQGLDFLTNYVQSIRFDHLLNGATNYTSIYSNFGSGAEIIGLLSTPQTNYNSLYTTPYFSNNNFIVSAIVRALSGPATAQQSENLVKSGMIPSMSFTYNMEVFISPFNSFAPSTITYNNPNLDSNQNYINYNRYLVANPLAGTANTNTSTYLNVGSGGLVYNLFDVRLRFSWPVFQSGNVGPGRQTYRTLVSSQLLQTSIGNTNVWFFQPQNFTNVEPQNL